MKPRGLALIAALLLAATAPLLPKASSPDPRAADFSGWPDRYEGIELRRMPEGPQDEWFARDFPGRVARFSAGERQLVVRWINSPTRRLHPASHCFEGAGYELAPQPMRRSADGELMSCFIARKDGVGLRVCEQLRDSRGNSFPDVSTWYWNAIAAPAGSSFWSYVVVEHER